MSSEKLSHELHEVDPNLYARAVMSIMTRGDSDEVLAAEIKQAFKTDFPNLLTATDMVRLQAERMGVDPIAATDMQRGAMIALQGLKEMIDLERLERIQEL